MRLTKTQPAGLKIKASRASLRFSFLFVLAAAFAAAQCTNNNLYDTLANPGGQGSNGPHQTLLPVFVSSAQTNGNFETGPFNSAWSNACSGLQAFAMADCACNQMAQAANLPTMSYVAWVSTAGDDMTCRIQKSTGSFNNCTLPPGGPTWVDTLGNIIAQGYAELFSGTLRNPIGYNENKTSVSSNVWTGTAQTGLAAGDHCFGWSDATSGKSGNQGAALFSDYQWTEGANTPDCTGSFPIYCFGIE